MTNYDTNKEYIQYIDDVLSGKELAGWFVRKACERAKSWFYRDDIELRYEEIDRKIKLVQKIKQKKGLHAGKPFMLLPFQQFIFMNIFGWYYCNTEKRVISNVLLMMARQTGKSYISAAISLAIALDKTLPSPTVDYLANSAKQAAIAFGHCKDQTSSLDPNGKIFSRYRSEIRIPLTGASINVLSADDSKLDGRASYFVVDELHEMKNWNIWEVMASGQGSLKNPLAIGISTTGWHMGEQYPLYNMWQQAKNILSGTIEDDSWFYMIFQLDDDDDWQDENVWKKAIPTLGIAVDRDFIKKRIQEAKNNPTKEVKVKTKNLNMWCQSAETWIPDEFVAAISKSFNLSDFDPENDYCYVGADLAETDDLCALTVLIEKDEVLYFKAFPFINKRALKESKNKEMYAQWVKKGYLILVDDIYTDLDWVVNKVIEINEQVPVALIAYDPWHGKQFSIKCRNAGIPVKAVGQGIANFSEPTIELEQRIFAARNIIFDDNPVIRWCFANVVLKRDSNQNKKPEKSDGSNKIDIIIAFLQTMKMYIDINGTTSDFTDVTVLS